MAESALRIEVEPLIANRRLEKRAEEAREVLGIPLEDIAEAAVYKIAAPGGVPQDILREIFSDPLLQNLRTRAAPYDFGGKEPAFVAEVSFRPGVTDNAAASAAEALALAGVRARVSSGAVYFLFGNIDAAGAGKVARGLLANDLIQKAEVFAAAEFFARPRFENAALPAVVLSAPARAEVISLDLDDVGLAALSRERCLALTPAELRHARAQMGRNPTDAALEIIAQSWSEHCRHKIFGANITYTGPGGETRRIESLYRTYVKRATQEIQKERGIDWLVSVFSDNAGIVRFDPLVDLCIKVETHNSPSALDPYGGALTGILGVNRDILGAGLGARPVANTDVFCLAAPAAGDDSHMPAGPQPPRRVLEGVHRGVEDGGNKSGIPTVNGAFFFDDDYAGKPLVFVGTVGVMPRRLPGGRPAAEKMARVGDRVVMVGGAIGADGIHGATFSSLDLDETAPATAVQIGDPLTQKRMTDFILEARDLGLYTAITDNGAGGLSSSVGEMAQMTGGARIDLALCPVKYPGLAPWELMVSESQERMTLAVPPENLRAFLDLAARRGVAATDIGAFTDDGRLRVFYGAEEAADLSLSFLHDSLPPMEMTAEWRRPLPRARWHDLPRRAAAAPGLEAALLALLQSPNITSKESRVRAYDHEVQAATHVKPLAGDAGAIWLHPHGGLPDNAVAIGCGLAPRLSLVDPYLMAQCAVDEALRNVVATGGDPDMCCLLDNFCWPDPVDSPYRLGQLVRACEGLYDICKAYGSPLVSGKDSMKNGFRGRNRRGEQIEVSVLPTLMVTAMARMRVGTFPGIAFRAAGDAIYLLGVAGPQGLAQSELSYTCGVEDARAPGIDPAANIALYRRFHAALREGLLRAAHDLSEGGLLVAVAECMIAGGRGARLDIAGDLDTCFNEAPGRLLASVATADCAAFEAFFKGMACARIGTVTEEEALVLPGVQIPLSGLTAAWRKGI